MDPVTRAKVHFVDLKKQQSAKNQETSEGMAGWTNLLEYIDADQLLSDYGGSADFVFEQKGYWAAVSSS